MLTIPNKVKEALELTDKHTRKIKIFCYHGTSVFTFYPLIVTWPICIEALSPIVTQEKKDTQEKGETNLAIFPRKPSKKSQKLFQKQSRTHK